ncbi:hypothetical protein [Tsukamurella soli]|uniref:Uncharacterized protein n=1 Tax=Tsukamurella soli TaxID=644556 RepID=A0ABP8KID8_9ACTN
MPEELSDAEAARYHAVHAAGTDWSAAIRSGSDDERDAAGAAFEQALTQLRPDETLNKLHVPNDADEWRDGLVRLMCRIPDGWGRWISCSKGWYPLLVQLDADLAAIDPGYELHQCKEKYGTLRFYFDTDTDVDAARTRMNALVDAAEDRSARTCDRCGEPGAMHVRNGSGWMRTLCAARAAVDDYEPVGETVTELIPGRRGAWELTTSDGDAYLDLNHGQLEHGGEPHRPIEVLDWPAVGDRARVRLPDGGEWTSGTITRIERIR